MTSSKAGSALRVCLSVDETRRKKMLERGPRIIQR